MGGACVTKRYYVGSTQLLQPCFTARNLGINGVFEVQRAQHKQLEQGSIGCTRRRASQSRPRPEILPSAGRIGECSDRPGPQQRLLERSEWRCTVHLVSVCICVTSNGLLLACGCFAAGAGAVQRGAAAVRRGDGG